MRSASEPTIFDCHGKPFKEFVKAEGGFPKLHITATGCTYIVEVPGINCFPWIDASNADALGTSVTVLTDVVGVSVPCPISNRGATTAAATAAVVCG